MNIAFIGSKGIPAKYGGFETFVECVAVPLHEKYGYNVFVVGDSSQKKATKGLKSYKGVKLLYSNFHKSKAPNLFYFESLLKVFPHARTIYACGVGGALSIWVALLFGKTYITNPDGVGWRRAKYSRTKQVLLKKLFEVAYKKSSIMVPDSKGIEKVMEHEIGAHPNTRVIEYGSKLNEYIELDDDETRKVLAHYDLISGAYHLVVARLEPENNVMMIVKGYLEMVSPRFPLIIVGNLLETNYVTELVTLENENLRFIGGIYDPVALAIVRAHATTYIHGHSVGGTNPSLLEAMGSKNLCVCHDNIFNREVTDQQGLFFDSESEVASILTEVESGNRTEKFEKMREAVYRRVVDYYNWDRIVSEYAKLFGEL